MMLLTCHFIRPWCLLLLIPCLIYLYISTAAITGNWYQLLSKHHPYRQKRSLFRWHTTRWKNIVWPLPPLLFFCSIILVLSGPSWEKNDVVITTPPTVIVADVSQPDTNRNALLHNIIEQLSPSPTAIVAYSGSAHTIVPLTTDKTTAHYLSQAIDQDIMPMGGQRPEKGIEKALQLLTQVHSKKGRIILITHGLNSEKIAVIHKLLSGSGATMDIIMTEAHLNKEGLCDSLNALTASHHGHYIALNDNGPPAVGHTITSHEWKDSGHYFMPIVIISFLLMCQKSTSLLIILLCILGTAGGSRQAHAASQQQIIVAGENAWINKNYTRSAFYFGQLKTADGYYNQGNALAKIHQFNKALIAYKHALTLEPTHTDAEYNHRIILHLLKHTHAKNREHSSAAQTTELQNLIIQPKINELKHFLKRKLAIELREDQKNGGGFK